MPHVLSVFHRCLGCFWLLHTACPPSLCFCLVLFSLAPPTFKGRKKTLRLFSQPHPEISSECIFLHLDSFALAELDPVPSLGLLLCRDKVEAITAIELPSQSLPSQRACPCFAHVSGAPHSSLCLLFILNLTSVPRDIPERLPGEIKFKSLVYDFKNQINLVTSTSTHRTFATFGDLWLLL